MIIHPSSALLTSRLLRWETMREDSGASALGLNPKQITVQHVKGLQMSRHKVMKVKWIVLFWEGNKKTRHTGVSKRNKVNLYFFCLWNTEENNYFRNLKTLATQLTPVQPYFLLPLSPLLPSCTSWPNTPTIFLLFSPSSASLTIPPRPSYMLAAINAWIHFPCRTTLHSLSSTQY